jgi:hypothetical protein
MKLQAQISIESANNIRWLVIESDEHDTCGYFLYHHIDRDLAYDTWFKTIDEAFLAAQTQYGISKEDWVAIP